MSCLTRDLEFGGPFADTELKKINELTSESVVVAVATCSIGDGQRLSKSSFDMVEFTICRNF